jgi:DUF1680 family protein
VTTLNDPYCRNAFEKELAYLKKFDVDRLAAGFRRNAGLAPAAPPYGGWENSLIAGHFVGHYLTAVAQAWANGGGPELKARTDALVDALADAQAEDGFLFAMTGELPGLAQFDNVEAGRTNPWTEAWVPWYTLHKILAGLIDAYRLAGNRRALEAADRLGLWAYRRQAAWSAETRAVVLRTEYGGMNDCLYELYKLTRRKEHAIAAHAFDEDALFAGLAAGRDVLDGLHANTQIPKFLGALNRYLAWREIGAAEFEAAGDGRDIGFYRAAAEGFWEAVVGGHSYATGGNSRDERFGPAGALDAERSVLNCETCNAYNMLKLSLALLRLTGDAKYAAFYESAFVNSVLASQHPETGMTTYFQGMATGSFKVFGSEFDHLWCCTGTGTENFTKLPEGVYRRAGDVLSVDLYLASSFTMPDKGVVLTQAAALPDTDTATFGVAGSGRFELRLRLPDWLAERPVFVLNGRPAEPRAESGYAAFDRRWSDGDVLVVRLPMRVRGLKLPDADAWAFKFGPAVLSADLGSEAMETLPHGIGVLKATLVAGIDDAIRVPGRYGSPADWIADADANFERLPGPLAFRLRNAEPALVFAPHFRRYRERYGIYWYVRPAPDRA